MNATIQSIWYLTNSGTVYTNTTDQFGTDWKGAHSSALFRILRAAENGAKIKVHREDGNNADWTMTYPNGYSCHYILKTTEE